MAFLVRDQNWGTYTPQIDSMWVKEEAGRFTVEYRAVCADANQRLQFAARIIGSNDGGLVFDAVATGAANAAGARGPARQGIRVIRDHDQSAPSRGR
jgi:hypothetical protein